MPVERRARWFRIHGVGPSRPYRYPEYAVIQEVIYFLIESTVGAGVYRKGFPLLSRMEFKITTDPKLSRK